MVGIWIMELGFHFFFFFFETPIPFEPKVEKNDLWE